jgi:hypothetical protein
MKRAMTVALVALGLVACSKPTSGGASTGAAPSASSAAAAPTATTASTSSDTTGGDPALQKEGLWSIHTVTVENPGDKKREGNQSVCRNHAYDAYARTLAKRPECKIAETFTRGAMVSDSECTIAGSVLHTKANVTFTGDTAAHSEMHTTYTPAAYGVAESTMTMDQAYVGPCPAGTEPGDIMGADGNRMSRWKH